MGREVTPRFDRRRSTPAGAAALRTVVIDDSRPLRALARAHLEVDGGFVVVGEGSDGASGIEAVRRHRPAVVLLDIRMPGMDGFAALPRIRELVPAAYIVVHSSLDPSEAAGRAHAMGADAYLMKDACAALPDRLRSLLAPLQRRSA